MQLRLFACRAGSPTLWEIDDPTVFTDAGADIAPVFETHPVDFGPARGYGRFRECVQWVALFGDATIAITPVADGTRLTEQTVTQVLSVADGVEQRVEVPVSAPGARFGVEIALSGCTALTELGEADLTYVNRRTLTGGR
jgi:hypothetical protein